MTDTEVAKMLRVGRSTLATWRRNRKGPKWFQADGPQSAVRYRRSDVEEWIEERLHTDLTSGDRQ